MTSPLDFPPHHLISNNRYDSPAKVFRTLYCAESPQTCLSEVLAQFRPSVADKDQFRRTGTKRWNDVPMAWRRNHVLVSASLNVTSGAILSLEDQALLVSLEEDLAPELIARGVRHLTLAMTQDEDRGLTQAVAHALFHRGAAGLRYPSKFDGSWCFVLFEGRAELIQSGDAKRLSDPVPEFDEVCDTYKLTLEP